MTGGRRLGDQYKHRKQTAAHKCFMSYNYVLRLQVNTATSCTAFAVSLLRRIIEICCILLSETDPLFVCFTVTLRCYVNEYMGRVSKGTITVLYVLVSILVM
jgi:hypothetical protein